jgi:hypothetical protein
MVQNKEPQTFLGRSFKKPAFVILSALLLTITNFIYINAAFAVTVTATGTNPTICNQTVNISTGVTASRLSGGDCLVTFTATATSYSWTAPAGVTSVQYLIVGGGGSGGTGWDNVGAGGGGGGMVETGTYSVTPNSSYAITIGAGGAQSPAQETFENGYAGGSTTFDQLTALGGGYGYTARWNSGTVQAAGVKQNGTIAAATGGSGGYSSSQGGAGGGGAGGNGVSATTSSGTSGGVGISSSITGTAMTYGAGGNGGNGNIGSSVTGANGTANTGNGSGGGSATSSSYATGGIGGSGIVIIRYATQYTITYNANTGSGTVPIDSNTYSLGGGSYATVASGSTLSLTGYSFSGWCTVQVSPAVSCSGTTYTAGQSFIPSSSLILYALWGYMPTTITLSFDSLGNNFQFQKSMNIIATVTGSDGTVAFFYNNKKILRCGAIATSGLSGTCPWKPTAHGSILITAIFTPTTAGYLSSNSAPTYLNVSSRTLTRG